MGRGDWSVDWGTRAGAGVNWREWGVGTGAWTGARAQVQASIGAGALQASGGGVGTGAWTEARGFTGWIRACAGSRRGFGHGRAAGVGEGLRIEAWNGA